MEIIESVIRKLKFGKAISRNDLDGELLYYWYDCPTYSYYKYILICSIYAHSFVPHHYYYFIFI